MTATSNPAHDARRPRTAGSGRWRVLLQLLRRDVLDVGLAGGEPLDPVLVDVEADDVVADLDGAHGQRQADVALTDDQHPRILCHDPPPSDASGGRPQGPAVSVDDVLHRHLVRLLPAQEVDARCIVHAVGVRDEPVQVTQPGRQRADDPAGPP